jgi:hypothetical protein
MIIDLILVSHILHERFKSQVAMMHNILDLQKAEVGIAALSAERGGYRSGKLYYQTSRKCTTNYPTRRTR